MKRKLLTALLYGLPVIFFAVCYFLITTTEEDIAQGANTPPDVWYDLLAAFRNNARLSDMYAWAVINFFDYQYSFGVDTIFRLIDLAAALGLLALLVSLVLGRRPRWNLKDATIFAGSFLLIFLTPFGYTLYRGFSMIHNYLIIALALLGFSLPFLRKLSGKAIPTGYRKWYLAIPMGLVFGLSANFPPLAFLASYLLVKFIEWWKIRKQKSKWHKILPESWEWLMVGSMIYSMLIGYILGPGVSGYASDPVYTVSYDYVAVADIVTSLGGSVIRLVKHVIVNFGRTFVPALLFLALSWTIAWVYSKKTKMKLEFLPQEVGTRNLLMAILTFCGFCTLAGTQIIMPIRLCLPAYLGLVVVLLVLGVNWWKQLRPSQNALEFMGVGFAILIIVLISVRSFLAWDFHERVGDVLQTIEKSDESSLCINLDEATQRRKTPFNIMQQEETFVERRTTEQIIYGKRVTYCPR